MTIGQLMELLDNFGDHLSVFVEDNRERRYNIDLTESTDEDGRPCVILHPTGDRISQ